MRPTLVALCLALATMALLATSPALAKEKKPADPNKKACRSEIPTGSRMSTRLCHTLAEWAAIDTANETGARALSDHASRIGNATIN